MSPYPARLQALREVMDKHDVDACVIASADPHLSEYLPEYWLIRRWLTGFTGSVGLVTVTAKRASLWVDSRYWIQAGRELKGSGFTLERVHSAADQTYLQWLEQCVSRPGVIAVDGATLSWVAYETMHAALDESITIRLDLDLPGLIWQNRPGLPVAPVTQLADEIACQSRAEKLQTVRQRMKAKNASHHFISTLDDIAWVLNLRGSDVPFNPVFLAHLLITERDAQLFVNPEKIDENLRQMLTFDGVQLFDYDQTTQALSALDATDRLMFDPRRVVCAIINSSGATPILASNPTTLLKACKTEPQLRNWREVMRRDGAALCEFFAWLEKAIQQRGQHALNELMIDERLTAYRQQQRGFVSLSFSTIAAYNANGAMPHYQASEQSHAVIEGNGLLLIDSGGQYQGGTTDITRMVPVGALTEAQKSDCTAVLSAMIAMSRLRFPQGIAAPLIDAVARAPLWQRLLDYGHGTGHGVGYFLNVHEGPQVLSYRAPIHPDMALQPGMVTSNEPGLYRPGQWGVRIENLLCTRAADQSEFGHFLEFETLTLCPIDTRCLSPQLLQHDELQWLNHYHQQVRKQLESLVHGDALQWLLCRTEPLSL